MELAPEPELAKHSRHLFDLGDFAGGYLAVSLPAAVSLLVLQLLRIPRPAPRRDFSSGTEQRPLSRLVLQLKFLVTAVTAMTALSSGAIFVHFGWGVLTGATVVPLLLVFLAILWASKNHAMAS